MCSATVPAFSAASMSSGAVPSRSPIPAFSGAAAGCGGVGRAFLPLPRRPPRRAGVSCCAASRTVDRDRDPGFGGSFYEVLGIAQDGSFDEIKQAYKRMARKYHPDVSPPDLAGEYTKHFIELKEAYETLSDPVTRAMYDRDLAGGLHLCFSRRRGSEILEKSRWRERWEDQLVGLERRNMNTDSWGARMRRERHEVSSE